MWSADRTTVGNGNHYTCFNVEGKCKTVSYVFFAGNSKYPLYVDLNEGVTIEEALNQMYSNEQSSTIKTVVESWFESTDLDEEENLSKIDDVIYCNDRSMPDMTSNGWSKDGDAFSIYGIFYSPRIRENNGTPDLNCRHTTGNRDRFTYKDTVNGNGKLKWPVGLLTTDEIILAGGQLSTNSDYYLYTGQRFWSISPSSFSIYASEFYVTDLGLFASTEVRTNVGYGVRSVISLASHVTFANGGTGTEQNPYVVE